MEQTEEALQISADEFAEKAEVSSKVAYISQSNAMRRSGNEKETEIKTIEMELNSKQIVTSLCNISFRYCV